MNDIQYLNVVWIISSLILLRYGVTGDSNDLISAFIYIILIFCIFWFLGIREKRKEHEENLIFGDKVVGQWGK